MPKRALSHAAKEEIVRVVQTNKAVNKQAVRQIAIKYNVAPNAVKMEMDDELSFIQAKEELLKEKQLRKEKEMQIAQPTAVRIPALLGLLLFMEALISSESSIKRKTNHALSLTPKKRMRRKK